MSAQSNASPVIIKRKKIVANSAHHGGAWKVAYADFVTAMMAFFLLMWLLNATTEQQRQGLADYFNPTIPINPLSGGGDGAFGGDSIFSEDSLAENGTGASSLNPTSRDRASGRMQAGESGFGDADAKAFAEVEAALVGSTGESDVHPEMFKHIVTRVTDEGLVIELSDTEEVSLFDVLGDRPAPILEEIAAMLVRVTAIVRNPIAVEAHVSSRPVVIADNRGWELSADRAQAMRRLLVEQRLNPERLQRVTGHADREPAVSEDRMAPQNDRLEIVLLRNTPR